MRIASSTTRSRTSSTTRKKAVRETVDTTAQRRVPNRGSTGTSVRSTAPRPDANVEALGQKLGRHQRSGWLLERTQSASVKHQKVGPPTAHQLERALEQLARTAEPTVLDRFFGPGASRASWNGPRGLRKRLGLPLDEETLRESLTYPVCVGSNARLYRGNIYLNQFHGQTSVAGRKLSFTRVRETLMAHQPWLQWRGDTGCYVPHASGAERPLWESLGQRRVYRVTSFHEAAYLSAVGDLLRGAPAAERWREIVRTLRKTLSSWHLTDASKGALRTWIERLERKPPSGATERRQLARLLVGLIQQCSGQGPGAASHALFAGTRPWNLNRPLPDSRKVVVTFSADFANAPPAVARGTYVGIEANYVELAFTSTEAKLFAIRHMSPCEVPASLGS